MTYEEIQELNGTQPYSFESDREEQWYKCGLVEGADVAYAQAKKDFMKKAKSYFERRSVGELNAGKEYADFKRFMSK